MVDNRMINWRAQCNSTGLTNSATKDSISDDYYSVRYCNSVFTSYSQAAGLDRGSLSRVQISVQPTPLSASARYSSLYRDALELRIDGCRCIRPRLSEIKIMSPTNTRLREYTTSYVALTTTGVTDRQARRCPISTATTLTALVVFAAFDYSLTPSLIAIGFFAVSVGNLAKVLPLTPGGVGLHEGAFTVIVAPLTPVGVTTALSIAIVDHAVKNIVTILGGVISMAWLNVSLTTAVEQAQTVDKTTEKAD